MKSCEKKVRELVALLNLYVAMAERDDYSWERVFAEVPQTRTAALASRRKLAS